MNFNEFPYKRMEKEATIKQYQIIRIALQSANTYEDFKRAFADYQKLEQAIDTMYSLCSTRHNINNANAFYKEENDYWDEVLPIFQNELHQLYQAILGSAFIAELKKVLPATYFKLVKDALDIFDESIIPYLQEENRLCSEYDRVLTSARLQFEGKEYTLTNFTPVLTSTCRETRKGAYDVLCNYFEEQEDVFDTIYDQLVRVRDKMAKKLGYENYIPFGYKRMNRLDYSQEDVSIYREEVLREVVPFATLLYDKQKQRLNVDTLACYDEAYKFKSGNPKPKHNKDEMVQIAKTMYSELSLQTKEFFDYMVKHELMDLESKPNKAGGGYCTMFPQYEAPFIFSNFNGTSGDVDVLTHEAGHALQMYASRFIKPLECISPTLESCEIHSMSMEFFAWPWMHAFFEEDCEKYYYSHLSSAFTFLPYGVLVDHFQHEVYAHPEASKEERKNMWRTLEKQYLPHKNYKGFSIFEKGGWWYRQSHIFQNPFYYIDYTLAQVCALQFWVRLQNQDPNAFKDYYEICKVGGTLSFTQICERANIINPFTKGCLKEVVEKSKAYLLAIDDSEF